MLAIYPGGIAALRALMGGSGAAATAPVKTSNPSIAVLGGGSPLVGATLQATRGGYTGIIGGYSGQWYSGVSPIALATSLVYTLQPGDLGANLTYQEHAYNIAGSSSTGTSNVIGPVTSGGGGGGFTPSIVDIDGNPLTTPLVGDALYGKVVGGTADSYIVEVYDDNGPIIGTSQPFVDGEPIYLSLEADAGHPLRLGFTPVTGGVSGAEVLSAATAAVAMPVLTPPVLARTSGSGVVPFACTMTYDATVRAGDVAHMLVSNPDDSSVLQDLEHQITQTELDSGGSLASDWSDAAPSALVLPTGTQEVKVEIIRVVPGMTTDSGLEGVSSGYSNVIAPTDVAYGPELFRDISFDGPNFAGGGYWVTANPFAGGSLNPTNSAQLCYQTLAAPLEIGATYRWILIGNKTDYPGGAVRISLGSSNGADIRLTSATLANGNFTVAGNFTADIAASDVSLEAAAAIFSGSLYSTSLRKIL